MLYIKDCVEKCKKPDKMKIVTKYKGFIDNVHKAVEQVHEEFNIPEKAMKLITPYWCYQGSALTELIFTT